MPLYEFQCNGGHTFELALPMSEAAGPRRCQICSCRAHRIMSAANVNVDAVMKSGDITYTPPMSSYLGRRRWAKKQEAKREKKIAAKNPVTI